MAKSELQEIWLSRDKDRLHDWIWEHFGLKFPRKAVCIDRGHCAPYDALAEVFFNRDTNYFLLGGRGTGKTLLIAVIHALNTLCHDNFETLSTGAVKEQAKKCWDYFLSLIKKPVFSCIYDPDLVKSDYAEFLNLSKASIVAGTVEQMNGPHPQELGLDEVEIFDKKAYREAKFVPKGRPGLPAQTIQTTSRKFPFGPAETLLRAIDEDPDIGIKKFVWCVFDAIETCKELTCAPCKRKKRVDGKSFYETCHLMKDAEGNDLMRAKLADGHYGLTELWRTWTDPTTDPADFDSQMLSLRPSTENLVWSMFEESIHVKPPEWIDEQLKMQPKPLKVACGLDFGWRDPTVILFAYKQGETIYILDEIYKPAVHPEDLMPELQEKEWRNQCKVDIIFADKSSPDLIDKYRKAGFEVVGADNSIDTGLSEVATLLRYRTDGEEITEPPHLYFSERCKNTISDIREYHWRLQKPEELSQMARRTPDAHQSDHGADATRYVVMGLRSGVESHTIMPAPIAEWGGWGEGFSDAGWDLSDGW